MNDIHGFLAHKAYNMRVSVLEATTAAGSGHPTSCLSAADIMAALFFHALHIDLKNPDNPNNDRFVLSKGHAAPLLYAAYKELGVLSHEEILKNRSFDSVLEGHPTPRFKYVDVATGSLGIGLSVGAGMALHAQRHDLSYYTYVLLGDSELSEGSIWEAAALAANYKLSHLIAIVDANQLGQRGAPMNGFDVENLARKFEAFSWQTTIINGHDNAELVNALDAARTHTQDKPQVIIAKTIKGYGIASVEGKNGYHGKVFTAEQLPELLDELKKRFDQPSWTHDVLYTPPTVVSGKKLAHQQIQLGKTSYKLGQEIATRVAFGQTLCEAGKNNKQLVCLDAEVSNSTETTEFAEQYPDQFVECFIAEQNMVGVGMGMAALGDVSLISTFGCFLTRAHDQLRMAAISQLPLRVVGSHAGTEIGVDGPSQMALEDIALFRSLPNSIILYPCDAVSCHYLTELMLDYADGISYLRTTRGVTSVIYDNDTNFTIGGFNILHSSDHDQAVIIGAGITVHETLKAHDELKKQSIFVAVVDLYCVKPLDINKIRDVVARSGGRVIVVEDHYVAGGIGEAVSAALIGISTQLVSLAITSVPRSGTAAQLRSWQKIDATAIEQAVLSLL